MKTATVLVAVLALAGCAPPEPTGGPAPVLSGTLVDLTYPYDERTLYWPTAGGFELTIESAGVTEAGYYYAANSFCSAEHGGTHLDAPIHFAEGGHTADEIPLKRLVGPGAVVDVTVASADDPGYLITTSDVTRWETAHGRTVDGLIVLFRTGFGAYWPEAEQYLGTAERGAGAVPKLRFPGLHPDTARWLAEERDVSAVGIDTASIDAGQSTLFEAHRELFAANVPAFENVANLERLPEIGFTVVALPMKIAGGSGGPLRIIAVVDEP